MSCSIKVAFPSVALNYGIKLGGVVVFIIRFDVGVFTCITIVGLPCSAVAGDKLIVAIIAIVVLHIAVVESDMASQPEEFAHVFQEFAVVENYVLCAFAYHNATLALGKGAVAERESTALIVTHVNIHCTLRAIVDGCVVHQQIAAMAYVHSNLAAAVDVASVDIGGAAVVEGEYAAAACAAICVAELEVVKCEVFAVLKVQHIGIARSDLQFYRFISVAFDGKAYHACDNQFGPIVLLVKIYAEVQLGCIPVDGWNLSCCNHAINSLGNVKGL